MGHCPGLHLSALIQNVVSSALIDIRWCDVIQRFVVSLMIVVINPSAIALSNSHG